MGWEIDVTAQATEWLLSLPAKQFAAIGVSIDKLAEHGPALGRPFVDTITGSRHANMKELRSVGGNLRALFAFDPQRNAIILIGGDKTNDWTGWYRRNIPIADDLYDQHLHHLTP